MRGLYVKKLTTLILTVSLVACGGGGGGGATSTSTTTTTNAAATSVRVTVTPSLGQFGAGATVYARKLDGTLIAQGAVDSTGKATLEVPPTTLPPYIVEAGISGDQYYDEKLKTMVTITLPSGRTAALRAVLPSPRTEVAVTPLTEMATGLIENESASGLSAANVASVLAANNTVYTLFPYDSRPTGEDSPILRPPTLVKAGSAAPTPTTSPDRYAQVLGGLAFLAATGKNALDVAWDLRDDLKDGQFDMHKGSVFPYTGRRDYTIALRVIGSPGTPLTSLSSASVTAAVAAAAAAGQSAYNSANTTTAINACLLKVQSTCSPASMYVQAYNKRMTSEYYNLIRAAITAADASYTTPATYGAMNLYTPNGYYYAGVLMEASRYATAYQGQWLAQDKFVSLLEYVSYSLAYGGTGITNYYDGTSHVLSDDSYAFMGAIDNVYASLTDPHTPGTACNYLANQPGHYNNLGQCVSGAPTGSTGGSSSTTSSASGYQCPTTKPAFSPDWIQSHASYWAAASAHDAYTSCLATGTQSSCQSYYDLETQYCRYAYQACIVVASAADCPG